MTHLVVHMTAMLWVFLCISVSHSPGPDGNYDVRIPQEMEGGFYSIRIGLFDNDSLFGCSPMFEVQSLEEFTGNDDQVQYMSEGLRQSDDSSMDSLMSSTRPIVIRTY